MSVPPESVMARKCYLLPEGKVARVLRIFRGGQVHYESRPGSNVRAIGREAGILDLNAFAFLVEREVPCNWTPEIDDERP